MAVLKRSRLNQKDIDRIREGRAKDAEAEQGIPRPVGSGINNKLTVEDMCGTLEITDERWLEMKALCGEIFYGEKVASKGEKSRRGSKKRDPEAISRAAARLSEKFEELQCCEGNWAAIDMIHKRIETHNRWILRRNRRIKEPERHMYDKARAQLRLHESEVERLKGVCKEYIDANYGPPEDDDELLDHDGYSDNEGEEMDAGESEMEEIEEPPPKKAAYNRQIPQEAREKGLTNRIGKGSKPPSTTRHMPSKPAHNRPPKPTLARPVNPPVDAQIEQPRPTKRARAPNPTLTNPVDPRIEPPRSTKPARASKPTLNSPGELQFEHPKPAHTRPPKPMVSRPVEPPVEPQIEQPRPSRTAKTAYTRTPKPTLASPVDLMVEPRCEPRTNPSRDAFGFDEDGYNGQQRDRMLFDRNGKNEAGQTTGLFPPCLLKLLRKRVDQLAQQGKWVEPALPIFLPDYIGQLGLSFNKVVKATGLDKDVEYLTQISTRPSTAPKITSRPSPAPKTAKGRSLMAAKTAAAGWGIMDLGSGF